MTPRQKAGNRRVERKRVVVEYAIGKMKVWRAAAERWRNPPAAHAGDEEHRRAAQPQVRRVSHLGRNRRDAPEYHTG